MPFTSAQLTAAYTAANDGVAPNGATAGLLAAFAAETQTGQLSDAAALAFVINSTEGTTEVAEQAYQFFTGKTPTKAGLDFLVNSATNPTDLNDPFYAQFDNTNRYINFAANLGLFGDGAAAFAANYGALSFSDFVNVAYETVIGSSFATAAGINVAAAKADIISRQANFVQIAKDRGLITSTTTAAQQDLAVKAELIGYLMSEGVKADVGIYAAGANNFVQALINGNPQYNVDLIGTYSVLGGGTGSAVGGQGATAGGTTLAMTAGIDALTGTVGNDTFVGDNTTVTAADSLNGGAGSDTFRYFTNAAGGAVPQLTSVENVNLVNSQGAIDLSSATGVQNVTLEGNTLAAETVTVGSGVNVALLNITNANAETFATASGTQSSMTLTLQGNSGQEAVNLNGAGLSTLNIQSNGTSTNRIASLASTGTIGTVKVSGPAAFRVNAALANSVTTLDASGATGGVNIIMGTSASAVTVKGSSGSDTVDLSNETGVLTVAMGAGNDTVVLGANVVAVGSTVDGGDGTDVLSVTKAVAGGGGAQAIGNFTAGNSAGFVNFETLAISTAGSAPTALTDVATFDATTLPAGISLFNVTGGTAGVTMNNLAAAPVVTLSGSLTGANNNGLVINLKTTSGSSDVANVTFAGSATTGAGVSTTALSAPGVETINLTSTNAIGATPNTLTKLVADASLGTVKITGNGALALTTDNMTHALTIDGSAATGMLNIDASATTTAGVLVNVNGGTAADSIKAGLGAVLGGVAPNQLIYGAGGGDAVDLGAAHAPVDTLVYKAGSDSLLDLVNASGFTATVANNPATMDAVTNFITGHDKVDLTAFALTNAQAVIADKGNVASLTALAAATASATFFTDASNTARGVAEVHTATDTYLFVDVNHNGVFDAGTDLAIKFVGIGSIASADLLH